MSCHSPVNKHAPEPAPTAADSTKATSQPYSSTPKNDTAADFGVGITNTRDSVSKNNKYKDIKVLVSTNRYICIKDCKDSPLIIDRDTVNYGYILSRQGHAIATSYNSVHSEFSSYTQSYKASFPF